MIISWKRCGSVTEQHSTSVVQWIVAMSEYGDLKTHVSMWSINMTLQNQCVLCNLQSKSVWSTLLCWRNRYWHDISWHVATVANTTVAKHTDIHIPARWKSRPLPLWGSSVPEHSVTRTLDRECVWKWPTTDAMAPEVPWHYDLWFFSLGICQRPGIRPTIATWPRLPKGMDHCRSEEYRCTHVDVCVTRTWILYRCVPCHPWCTHRTSLVVKKTFSVFLWLWTIPLR